MMYVHIRHRTLATFGVLTMCASLGLSGCGGSSLANTDASTVDASTGADADEPPTDAGAVRDGGAADDAGAAQDAGAPEVKGFAGNYSSPTIVRVGATYHAYFAQQNIGGHHYNTPYATFTEDGNFTFHGDALPHMGAETTPGLTWAPGVARIDATHWVLYYTAHRAGTDMQKCLFRAHSSTPEGPFVDDYDGPLYCQPRPLWAIDAYPVRDAGGAWHLAARVDHSGGINTISIRKLGPKGENFASGSTWLVLTSHSDATVWERPVMENAGIVRLRPPTGKPHWFVFYSGGAWYDNRYSVGYADCGTGLSDGACDKKTVNAPWLATDASVDLYGPGTPTFYRNQAGEMMMSVQAWQYSGGKSNRKNDGQIMRTYQITINDNYRPKATLVRVDLH
ncbi:MAG TPA: family 43 glycosylhydrolase [Kofleriaceae bacterium]|nr:family 43 glycosylhydrolase [Kofleriaceae bacterium]